jgi:hypothetical protein
MILDRLSYLRSRKFTETVVAREDYFADYILGFGNLERFSKARAGYLGGASLIFKRRRLSCSAVQYLQSSRIKTDVYGIVMLVFKTRT